MSEQPNYLSGTRPLPQINAHAAKRAIEEAVRLFNEAQVCPTSKEGEADMRHFLDVLAPKGLRGLPCTYHVGQKVRYNSEKDGSGNPINGVIVASVTHCESYVVGPGDDRAKTGDNLLMMDVGRIHPREKDVSK